MNNLIHFETEFISGLVFYILTRFSCDARFDACLKLTFGYLSAAVIVMQIIHIYAV